MRRNLADVDGPERVGSWRDPAGRRSPRGAGTPPRHCPACRRSSRSVHPKRSTDRQVAMRLPTEREIGDRRDSRRSRWRGRRQRASEFAYPSRCIVCRRPFIAERLGRRVAVEPFARAIEPAPDSDVVVRAGKVADDKGQEVEPGGDHVRRRAGARYVAPRTGLRDTDKAGQQVQSQHALQGAPFVRGGRRLVPGVVDPLRQGGNSDRLGARPGNCGLRRRKRRAARRARVGRARRGAGSPAPPV